MSKVPFSEGVEIEILDDDHMLRSGYTRQDVVAHLTHFARNIWNVPVEDLVRIRRRLMAAIDLEKRPR